MEAGDYRDERTSYLIAKVWNIFYAHPVADFLKFETKMINIISKRSKATIKLVHVAYYSVIFILKSNCIHIIRPAICYSSRTTTLTKVIIQMLNEIEKKILRRKWGQSMLEMGGALY